jgi:hypothetical protein
LEGINREQSDLISLLLFFKIRKIGYRRDSLEDCVLKQAEARSTIPCERPG